MKRRVPDSQEMGGDDQTPCFSTANTPATRQEEVMELTWENGPVMVQRSSSSKRNSNPFVGGSSQSPAIPDQQLFIEEEEMASWLQHNLNNSFDHELYADLMYSAPPPPIAAIAQPPPIAAIAPPSLLNFPHFSRFATVGPTVTKPLVGREREVTVVESNETPELQPNAANTESLATGTCEITLVSSTSGSVATTYTAGLNQPPESSTRAAAEDPKRKAKEIDSQSQDTGSEAAEAKRQGQGSSSTKRSRAAEVHNLSERKRRDRINEKIRTIQELIPGCNKLDKASILDEAIEYLKSLQLQVQMMSMGYGMMYPGMQQYMPAIRMMGIGMNRPILPYPPADANPRLSMPAFHLPQVPIHDPSINQASNQNDLMLNLLVGHNPSHPRMPNFVSPYQQFVGLHHGQVSSPQNQELVQPSGNKPSSSCSCSSSSSSKDICNPENQQTG